MTQHTPGPWAIRDLFEGTLPIDFWNGDASEEVCRVSDDDTGAATQEANARLIAAAPDLLAALKNVAVIAKNLHAYGEVDHAIAHDLNLLILPAIAKAEGRI